MRDKENNELHLTGLFSVFSFANLIKPYTSEVGSGRKSRVEICIADPDEGTKEQQERAWISPVSSVQRVFCRPRANHVRGGLRSKSVRSELRESE